MAILLQLLMDPLPSTQSGSLPTPTGWGLGAVLLQLLMDPLPSIQSGSVRCAFPRPWAGG